MHPGADEQEGPSKVKKMLDTVLCKLQKAQQALENEDYEEKNTQGSCLINTCQKPERESIDSKLLEVERKIKHIRATPNEASIRSRISGVQSDL
mmetsp:Transcript_5682/g.7620  ORF Transcript_5682/g.7620 Transcript_5682/m.7620 type:complete len:94 (-) Transcript_5682:447-728(-)